MDQLLVERGMADNRTQAAAVILSGNVFVNEEKSTKAGTPVRQDAIIRVSGSTNPFVSRGGLKLEGAIQQFAITATGKVALDIGSSTGGFSDCLLQRGAKQVYCVDVGFGQLDWKLRNRPEIKLLERTNARYLEFDQIGQTVDLIVIDASFISLTKLAPALLQFTTPSTEWVTLIKPQFEVGKGKVGKGGIVRSEEYRLEAIDTVTQGFERLGLRRIGLIESPLQGTDGNIEYLAYWKLKQ